MWFMEVSRCSPSTYKRFEPTQSEVNLGLGQKLTKIVPPIDLENAMWSCPTKRNRCLVTYEKFKIPLALSGFQKTHRNRLNFILSPQGKIHIARVHPSIRRIFLYFLQQSSMAILEVESIMEIQKERPILDHTIRNFSSHIKHTNEISTPFENILFERYKIVALQCSEAKQMAVQ